MENKNLGRHKYKYFRNFFEKNLSEELTALIYEHYRIEIDFNPKISQLVGAKNLYFTHETIKSEFIFWIRENIGISCLEIAQDGNVFGRCDERNLFSSSGVFSGLKFKTNEGRISIKIQKKTSNPYFTASFIVCYFNSKTVWLIKYLNTLK